MCEKLTKFVKFCYNQAILIRHRIFIQVEAKEYNGTFVIFFWLKQKSANRESSLFFMAIHRFYNYEMTYFVKYDII